MNDLHNAAYYGSTKRLVALLADGSRDIDQGTDPLGCTPLMMASTKGNSQAVRILLNNGANVSIKGGRGITALHLSAQEGYFAASKMLVEAGADLEAAMTNGSTPLLMAAEEGHSEVVSLLIEAGANPDSRKSDGATPLFMAAQEGHIDAVKVLLRAKANPLLTTNCPESGLIAAPLGMAAENGHLEVVRELVQQLGIEGCGGASGGVEALVQAAMNQDIEIMAVLTNAGVADTGDTLVGATTRGWELSIKFLLQQRKGDGAAYVNYRTINGETPLLHALGFSEFSSPSPRIVRLLVDAGADTTLALRVTNIEGELLLNGTPTGFVSYLLREKKIAGKDATEEQLNRLEGIRRLLLRVEAVRAVSFLWPVVTAPIGGSAEGTRKKVVTSTPLRMMLPILRRRARRPRVLLAALWRSSGKP